MKKLDIRKAPAKVTPVITLPSTDGLTFNRGSWLCGYSVNGKYKYRRLGTADRAAAELARDQFYADLKRKGATLHVRKPTAAVKTTGETRYVYYRKPYTVRLPGGKVIGDFATRHEAEAACLAALAERSMV